MSEGIDPSSLLCGHRQETPRLRSEVPTNERTNVPAAKSDKWLTSSSACISPKRRSLPCVAKSRNLAGKSVEAAIGPHRQDVRPDWAFRRRSSTTTEEMTNCSFFYVAASYYGVAAAVLLLLLQVDELSVLGSQVVHGRSDRMKLRSSGRDGWRRIQVNNLSWVSLAREKKAEEEDNRQSEDCCCSSSSTDSKNVFARRERGEWTLWNSVGSTATTNCVRVRRRTDLLLLHSYLSLLCLCNSRRRQKKTVEVIRAR